MKNVGVRVVSAALAACMITSILPVSAFAAVGVEPEGEIAAMEAKTEEGVQDGAAISAAGTYTLSSSYTQRITIDTPDNVTLKIAGNVTFAPENAAAQDAEEDTTQPLLYVQNVGTLTIEAETGAEIDAGENNILWVTETAANANVIIEGGTYKGSKTFTFDAGSAELKDVEAYAGHSAVVSNSAGKVTVTNGTYNVNNVSKAADKREAAFLNTEGSMELNNVTVTSTAGSALRNASGTVTICGGNYKTAGAVVATQAGGVTTVKSGTFERTEGPSCTFFNQGTLNIEQAGGTTRIKAQQGAIGVTNNGTLNFKGGTVTAPGGTGIVNAVTNTKATIDGGAIEDCMYGVFVQANDPDVVLKNVTFRGNRSDIALGADQLITIEKDSYSGTATVWAADAAEDRQVTTKTKDGEADYQAELKLYSRNDGFRVEYKKDAEGKEYRYLTAGAQDIPDPDNGDTGNGGSGSSIGGAIAAGVVAGTVAWGVYEAGTGIYRVVNMRGIPLPSTRAELALLIWRRADEPEPESTVLFEDIDEDDADLQKAAHWMVEQELMDEKDDNKFKPYGHVTKLRVCTTWNEAKEKGLID